MDLVIPAFPQLPIWPAERGLVVMTRDRNPHYVGRGVRTKEITDIDYFTDVVIRR